MAWTKDTSTTVALPDAEHFDSSHQLSDYESIYGEGRTISIDDLNIMDGLSAAVGDNAEAKQRLFSALSANTKQAQWDMKSTKLEDQSASVQAYFVDLQELLAPEYIDFAIKIFEKEADKPLCWDMLGGESHLVGTDHLVLLLLRNKYHRVQELDLYGGEAVFAEQLGKANLSDEFGPHALLDKTVDTKDGGGDGRTLRSRDERGKSSLPKWSSPSLSTPPTHAEIQVLKVRIRSAELKPTDVNQWRASNLAAWVFKQGEFILFDGTKAEGWGIFQKCTEAYDTLMGKKQQKEVKGKGSGFYNKADLDAYQSVASPLIGKGTLLDTIDTFIETAVETAQMKKEGCKLDLASLLSFQKLKNDFRLPPYPKDFDFDIGKPASGKKRGRAKDPKTDDVDDDDSPDVSDEGDDTKITPKEAGKLKSKIIKLMAERKELTGKVSSLQAEVAELKAQAQQAQRGQQEHPATTQDSDFNKFVFAMASRCVTSDQWDEFMDLHMPLLSHAMPSLTEDHAQVEELKAIMKKKWDYQDARKQKAKD